MRRAFSAAGCLAAVALGISSRLVPLHERLWDKSAGDLAYAVMVGFILLLFVPRAGAFRVVIATFFICFGVELFQLTGLPRQAPRLLRAVLGDTFAWHDVACYAVGSLGVGIAVAVARRTTT